MTNTVLYIKVADMKWLGSQFSMLGSVGMMFAPELFETESGRKLAPRERTRTWGTGLVQPLCGGTGDGQWVSER